MENLHPFSQYIRILGRGKKGARSLNQEEAYEAMGMILDGHIEPEQLGAFLMLVRVKEESSEEVAGFVRAVKERIEIPGHVPALDLDWSSYAGKRRHLPWFILSVLLLAENGVKTLMHGLTGRKDDRIYTAEALQSLGIDQSLSLSDASTQVEKNNFAFVSLETFSPRLKQLIDLRDILGLRSPVHTVSRMLNPFNAPNQMLGIFHPGYLDIHQGAAKYLGQPRSVTIKGDGGEIECNPDSICPLYLVDHEQVSQEEWPAVFAKRHTKPANLELGDLKKVWRGEINNEYGEQAIISTVAITLYMMKRADCRQEALDIALNMWDKRCKSSF